MRKYIMTITGPSCSGKTTLMKALINRSDVFSHLVTETTRAPRPGEDGAVNEYAFISEEEFLEKLETGTYYAQHVRFNGTYYGTPWIYIERAIAQCTPIRIVEPGGVDQFRRIAAEIGAEVVAVFVDEDPDVLLNRWCCRLREDPDPDIGFYTQRIMNTLFVETEWVNRMDYDFYFDLRYRQENEMLYALERIAHGGMSLGQIRQIAPRIKQEAA